MLWQLVMNSILHNIRLQTEGGLPYKNNRSNVGYTIHKAIE